MAFDRRSLPFLVAEKLLPDEGTGDEVTAEGWRIQREDLRKSYSPEPFYTYFRMRYPIKIRNGDSLFMFGSHSIPSDISNGETEGRTGFDDSPFVLMLHGGGYSGLTWGPMIDELSWLVEAEYGCLDLRGHGESNCQDGADLSLEILTQDVLDVIDWMQTGPIKLGKRRLILVGHSMGGAVGVNVALKLSDRKDVNLAGLVVLDVVEGSALMALNSMQFFLRSRPQEFKNMPEAIQWCVRSGQTKNLDSARISMVGQLKVETCGEFVSTLLNPHGVLEYNSPAFNPNSHLSELPEAQNAIEASDTEYNLIWRIDLSKTEPYWRGWFEGLSAKFLSVKVPKLLMLAGVDRLDKTLTVGQMQGKFQMHIFHQVGHAVHEDVPDKVAECLASFLNRQRLVKTKMQLTPSLPGC